MRIGYGNGPTEYGPGVSIEMTGDEVARAIMAWLVGRGVHIDGPRTVTVNGELCEAGRIYVDPEGFVITPRGRKYSGRGSESEKGEKCIVNHCRCCRYEWTSKPLKTKRVAQTVNGDEHA